MFRGINIFLNYIQYKGIYTKYFDFHFEVPISWNHKIIIGLLAIEQKGMTIYHDFCYSFSFSSSLFF